MVTDDKTLDLARVDPAWPLNDILEGLAAEGIVLAHLRTDFGEALLFTGSRGHDLAKVAGAALLKKEVQP